MTVVFSAASSYLIVMTVDSAVALDFKDRREYITGRKAFFFPGVGCVTTWGTRDHNRIEEFLDGQGISADSHFVTDLATLVNQYLVEEYRPDELSLDDVGYHVAGFDQEGCPRLSHVFWGFDRPRPPEQVQRKYEKYDHNPPAGSIVFLYNGRNDLAEVVVHTLLKQVNAGQETRFDLKTPAGLARFGDFVVRFAAELTPEVGPPFITFLISPQNEVARVKNDSFRPVNENEVASKLESLGYRSRAG